MALMLVPNAYRALLRPLLFRLPPETAQRVADSVLRLGPIWKTLAPALDYSNTSLETSLYGLKLRNPVGLAAGYDKNCEFLHSLAALGFGYVTGGTVTPNIQPGNRRPRIIRYTEEQSLVNSLGFPNQGVERVLGNLEASTASLSVPRVVSVSGTTVEEIVTCHRQIEPLVSAVEINISSPNTQGLRVFHDTYVLAELLEAVSNHSQKPLFVKIPPYMSKDVEKGGSEDRTMVLGVVDVCADHRVDGITVANTWPVRDDRLAVGRGGLSGKPIFDDMIRMVGEIRSAVGKSVAINACGGIFTGEDAWTALHAGADTVQVLTGLVYCGPGIVRSINKDLAHLMDRYELDSIEQIRDLPLPHSG